jgi:uncharacterized protein (TIGR03118 family)
MAMRERPWGRVGVAAAFATVLVIGGTAGSPATARHGDDGNGFTQRNLVSDVPGLAELDDPDVKNPWGIAFGPVGNATPLWVNNNFAPDPTQAIQLYAGATSPTTPIQKIGLHVTGSSPFGLVFNPTTDFKITQAGVLTPARFIFTEAFEGPGGAPEGRITGWSNVPAPAATTTSTDARKFPSLPFGLALVPGKGDRGNRLLVADAGGFAGGESGVDVYDAQFHKVTTPGLFVDPKAADEGLTPYNVASLKGRVYVSYVGDAGGGAISLFKANGKFKKRLVTNGPDGTLQSPWGMAIAPKRWGKFGGRLLVGNVDNGKINAFGARSGKFKGTLKDASGAPLVNAGLWGIAFGNGVIGTPNSLIFAAGIGNEVDDIAHTYEHGLIGLIEPTGKKDADDD